MKRFKLALALVLLTALTAWARPMSITCPIDGQSMYFHHSVGMYPNTVCWYTHMGRDPYTHQMSQHEGYVPCGD